MQFEQWRKPMGIEETAKRVASGFSKCLRCASYTTGRKNALCPQCSSELATMRIRAWFVEPPTPAPCRDWITAQARSRADSLGLNARADSFAGDMRLHTRRSMVRAIIARQVEQGGVDTEGTRHEAERWLAMVCGCVCEGLRATTEQSALRLARNDAWLVDPGIPNGRPLSRG